MEPFSNGTHSDFFLRTFAPIIKNICGSKCFIFFHITKPRKREFARYMHLVFTLLLFYIFPIKLQQEVLLSPKKRNVNTKENLTKEWQSYYRVVGPSSGSHNITFLQAQNCTATLKVPITENMGERGAYFPRKNIIYDNSDFTNRKFAILRIQKIACSINRVLPRTANRPKSTVSHLTAITVWFSNSCNSKLCLLILDTFSKLQMLLLNHNFCICYQKVSFINMVSPVYPQNAFTVNWDTKTGSGTVHDSLRKPDDK